MENRLTAVNIENLELKKNNESNENSIFDVERKCKTLEGDLKVEKKERQRMKIKP